MDRLILLTLIILVTAITINWSQMTHGSPAYNGGWYRNRLDEDQQPFVNDCENSNTTRELCQRCAKVTKSRLALTMCCERRESTREWCIKFLNFGITSASSTANTNVS